MTPEEQAADIMKRCWWDVKRDGEPHPGFKGLPDEITEAIRKAVAEERQRCAGIVRSAIAPGSGIRSEHLRTIASDIEQGAEV